MTRYSICTLLLIFALKISAQTPVLPYYLDQPLTYNPSLAGSLRSSNIQMGMTDIVEKGSLNTSSSSFSIYTTSIQDRDINEFGKGTYLAYINTDSVFQKSRVSYGLEYQKLTSANHFANPTSIGGFANLHLRILKYNPNIFLVSMGFKYQHLIRRANRDIVEYLVQREYEPSGYTSSEATDLFTTNGRQTALSFSFQFLKKRKTLIKLGINFATLEHKLIDSRDNDFIFIPSYYSRNENYGYVNASLNFAFNNFFAIELLALGGYGQSLGLSSRFRIKSNSILEFSVLKTFNYYNDGFTSLNANIINKRFKLSLTYGSTDFLFSIQNKFPFEIMQVFQLGATYGLKDGAKPTLLRLD